VQDDALVGIVTFRDLLRGHKRRWAKPQLSVTDLQAEQHFRIGEIMSDNVQVLELSGTLRDAARKMVATKIGCLPVVNGRQLAGIITDADLVRIFVHACV
jgi:acetoin utilization protein AcuB